MDFITELPVSDGCATLLTVVDRFSKMATFIALSSSSAIDVVQKFFERVVSEHGLP